MAAMPPSSTSLLFTWSAESIIVGLVSYAICEPNYLINAQIIIAGLTAVLHIAALAAALDAHHSIAVSYLCVITSMLAQTVLEPLESVGSMFTLACFIVMEIAALGMSFASCTGGTPLFFHQRGHFALLLGVGLDYMRCWNGIIGGGIALFIILAQCVPFASVGLAFSIGAAGAYTVWSFFASSWIHVGIGAVVFLTSTLWLLGTWLAAVPDVAPSAPSLPLVMPEVLRQPMVWPRMRPPLFKDL